MIAMFLVLREIGNQQYFTGVEPQEKVQHSDVRQTISNKTQI